MKDYPFIVDMPADEYHAAAKRGEYLSSHLLGDFRICPLLYKMRISGEIKDEDTAAFQTGRALHTLILEGSEKFNAEYFVGSGPINPKTGEPFGKVAKAYKAWRATQKKEVISENEFAWMSKLQQSVCHHPLANELLEHGRAEGTVRCTMRGERCQIRMDWFNPDYKGKPVIVDLKTTENLNGFLYSARRYGYDNQLAFYREVFHAASGRVYPDVYIIAIEKSEPHRCGVWKLTDGLLDQATATNNAAMARLKDCRKSNSWPTLFEDMQIWDI